MHNNSSRTRLFAAAIATTSTRGGSGHFKQTWIHSQQERKRERFREQELAFKNRLAADSEEQLRYNNVIITFLIIKIMMNINIKIVLNTKY